MGQWLDVVRAGAILVAQLVNCCKFFESPTRQYVLKTFNFRYPDHTHLRAVGLRHASTSTDGMHDDWPRSNHLGE